MKKKLARYAVVFGVGTAFLGPLGPAWGQSASVPGFVSTPESTIDLWPKKAKMIAGAIIEKYGEPNHFSDGSLIWYGNGPWKRTVVHRDGWLDAYSIRHEDVLEQVITYHVPKDRVYDLERFDSRLTVDKTANELAFRSDSEKTNFLNINLADEISARWKTVEEARAFAAKTVKLTGAGKTSAYTAGFMFQVYNDLRPIPD